MPSAIRTKAEMYRRLAAGQLGNTVPQWFDPYRWLCSADARRIELWGVRSTVGGGDPRSRLNVPRREVFDLYRSWFGDGAGGNISPMVDGYAQLRCEVIELPGLGLDLTFVDPRATLDPSHPWRDGFRRHARHVQGSAAVAVLRVYLWAADYDAVRGLLAEYPGHAVEFTACDRAIGTIPGRNTVIWEVRAY